MKRVLSILLAVTLFCSNTVLANSAPSHSACVSKEASASNITKPVLAWDQPLIKKTTVFTPFFHSVWIEDFITYFKIHWGTSYYVDYCQTGTIQVRRWSKNIFNTWTWMWVGYQIYVPPYEQSGVNTFSLSAGQAVNGEYQNGELSPWSGCN